MTNNTKLYFRSFAGGEISPSMLGRIDDAKYQSGAETVRNFIVLPQGAVENRPGTSFIRHAKYASKKCRLIPFTYSNEQTMVLEFGEKYIRFHSNGGTLTGKNCVVNPDFTDSIDGWKKTELDGSDIYYSSRDGGAAVLDSTISTPVISQSFQVVKGVKYTISASIDVYNVSGSVGEEVVQNGTFDDKFEHWLRSPGHSAFRIVKTTAGNGLEYNGSWGRSRTLSQYVETTPGVKYKIKVKSLNRRNTEFTINAGGETFTTRDFENSSVNKIYTLEFTAASSSTKIELVFAYYIGISVAVNTSYATIEYVSVKAVSQIESKNNTFGAYVTVYSGASRILRESVLTDESFEFEAASDQTLIVELSNENYDTRIYVRHLSIISDSSVEEPYEIETPFLEKDLFDLHYVQSADVLTVVHPSYQPRELRRLGEIRWDFPRIGFISDVPAPNVIELTKSGTEEEFEYSYGVTSIGEDFRLESKMSNEFSIMSNLLENKLLGTGATITVKWPRVSGAVYYRVYKKQGGIFGLIGYVKDADFRDQETAQLLDDNIAPDMSTTPPEFDNVFSVSEEYPCAVSYFEQRRCFAGTNKDPQTIWMTKSGTETNMSYSIPVKDDDRIKFRIASREASQIRHMVSINQLILLTASGEWRVTSVNSDAVTPTTIAVRPQSYVGASNVQPYVVNSSLVYCASRGGHVRELGYSWQANGYVTNDLSIRSSHLFDGKSIVDMSFSKSPEQVLWFVSSDGSLLGFTYVPEQQVGAWHKHDTDGKFESCACVSDGLEDHLYVVVNRTIDGKTSRMIERFESRAVDDLDDCWFLDSAVSFDGTNRSDTTITMSVVEDYKVVASEEGFSISTEEDYEIIFDDSSEDSRYGFARVTASDDIFNGSGIVGDYINVFENETVVSKYKIIEKISDSVVLVKPLQPFLYTASFSTTKWGIARDSFSGLGHLNGKNVGVFADGAVRHDSIVSNGSVNISPPAMKVVIGLRYTSEIKTLPAVVEIQGYGRMRPKAVNKVSLNVVSSSGVFIGPDSTNMVELKKRTTEPYGSPPSLKTDEVEVTLSPSWGRNGSVVVQQKYPLPLTIVGMTLDVTLGG